MKGYCRVDMGGSKAVSFEPHFSKDIVPLGPFLIHSLVQPLLFGFLYLGVFVEELED